MYPRLTDIFNDLFGIEVNLPLYSFGLMVAVAILVATHLTKLELDRMYARGIVGPVRYKDTDGKGRDRTLKGSPSVYIWTFMGLAAVFGVLGSKVFHIIDFWDEFVQRPAAFLFSASGLTFLGGLVFASIAILWYAKQKGIDRARLADAIAPGLILAYGIGRIGCYLSGDGDWGTCSQLEDKPAWIPGFLWSETFPRAHVGGEAVAQGAAPFDPVAWNAAQRGEVCSLASPDGVYPTMLYEFAMASVIAGLLWALRKHPFAGGWLISLYLVLGGLERFVIEFVRVNREVAFGLSQSQLISIVMIVAGIAGVVWTMRTRPEPAYAPPAGTPSAGTPASA
jgi:phosphatidylglycerol:prolipoprotein diacylglycerol transferase